MPFGAVQLTATLKDASGNELAGRNVGWSSSNAAVANVSSSGLVTGVVLGTVTITATAEGKSGTASITVKDGRAVGPSGATMTGLNGAVTLVIPAGALAQLTNIYVEATQGLPAEPRLVAGPAVDIGPNGTVFAQPATLTIRYTAANLPAGTHPDSLTLDTYANGVWSPVVGATVDTVARTLHASLGHLSTYGALIPAVIARLDVVSQKLRTALQDFDMCVNHAFAVIVAPYDATGNPLQPHVISAVSGSPNIATVKPISGAPNEFFFKGVSPGTAVVTFTSEAATQPVNARVTTCPKPPILSTSAKDGNLELYRYLAPTYTRLTNDQAADEFGKVAPDGSKIAFQSNRGGPDPKIYLMDPNGANVRPLLSSQGYQREVAWAPDGTWLVGVGPKPNGNPGIYRVNADGTGATLLTPNTSTEEGGPAISPGGLVIAFHQRDVSGSTPGLYRIMVMNADGTGVRQVFDNAGQNDVTPSFSPLKLPGNPEVIFIRNFADGSGSWVIRVRLNGVRPKVITGGGFHYLPSFCADGEHIIVVHSNVKDTAPFAIVVFDSFLKGSDDPPYIVPGVQQHIQVTYYPQPATPTLAYGCKP